MAESVSNNPGVGPRPSEDKPGKERRRGVSAERYVEEARRSQAQPQPAEASRDCCSRSESAKAPESAKEAAAGHAPPRLVRFKLNGKEVESLPGLNLIEAARREGVEIPFYCYHPGLTPAGNCRMCIVEASNAKKPITACTTPVSEGLEVLTDTDNVRRAREAVLELMLVNHPLDCPICDKAGECMLQDHTFDHGKDHSRMVEPKELKHTKEVGNEIYIWGNRCIVCTRCVRFCDEIAGTGELCVVNRGDHSVIDVHPDYPLTNALSGNVVDICPVGALIAKDFLYEARVWFQKRTESICTGCARGCNIEIQTLRNQVKRLLPRHNGEVNDYWMCDYGRHDHAYILGERRTLRYRLGASTNPLDAGRALHEGLRQTASAHGPEAIAVLASAFQSLEELFLVRQLAAALEVPDENVGALARPDGEEHVFKKGFKIAADKNPNRRGAVALLGAGVFGERTSALAERLRTGKVKGLVAFSDRPHCLLGAGPEGSALLEHLARLEFLAVFQLEKGAVLPESALILPATAFSEKDGTMMNEDGRVQRLRPATELPRGIRAETDVLQEVLRTLGAREREVPAGGLFEELAPALGLGGRTCSDVGAQGILAAGASPQPPPAAHGSAKESTAR